MCFTNVIAQGFKKRKRKKKRYVRKRPIMSLRIPIKQGSSKEGSSKWFSSINMRRSKGNDL